MSTFARAALAATLWICAPAGWAFAADVAVPCAAGRDVAPALEAALAGAPERIILQTRAPGDACALSRGLLIPPGLRLEGRGSPTLRLSRSGNAFRGDARSRDFTLSGLTIDASAAPAAPAIRLRGSADGRLQALRIIRPGDGVVLADGTRGVEIHDLEVTDSRGHGVMIVSSAGNTVDGARLNGQRGFGVILSGTSHGNRLAHLSTTRSGLELVGMTVGTHDNTLEDSTAANTGDNCYSITGSRNRLRNLAGERCAGNGIGLYGSGNTLEGGRFTNNAQRHDVRPAWAGGVAILQGFGGVAQGNTVRNVVVDDDQPRPTQQVGILTRPPSYQPWRPGVAVRAGRYAYSGLGLYVARSSGVTGTRAPEGEGRVSDGAVEWERVNEFDGTLQPDGNVVEGAQIGRVARTPREDGSEARRNVGTR